MAWIYYYVGFYIFCNVAAMPVLTITLRNNMIKLITPQYFPKKAYSITKWTLMYTLAILVVVITTAIGLKKYI